MVGGRREHIGDLSGDDNYNGRPNNNNSNNIKSG